MMNGFVWLGRLGAQRICHLFLAMTKSFCVVLANLFLINKIYTHAHTHTHSIMRCALGANDCVGHGPVANTQQPLGSPAEMTPRHHYQTKQLALRTGTVFLPLSPSLPLVFISFSLLFLFYFFFWLARKMKMFNGKNKILTFLSQANVIQFVLLVRKLK